MPAISPATDATSPKLGDPELVGNSDKELSPVDSSVGARLRARRKAMNLSGTELAEILGISAMQITRYETGKHRIGASRLHAIARALAVPVTYFFEEVEANYPIETLPEKKSSPVDTVNVPTHDAVGGEELPSQLQDLLTLGRMAAKTTDPQEKALIRRLIQSLPLFN